MISGSDVEIGNIGKKCNGVSNFIDGMDNSSKESFENVTGKHCNKLSVVVGSDLALSLCEKMPLL